MEAAVRRFETISELRFALNGIAQPRRRAHRGRARLLDNGFACRGVEPPAHALALRGHDLAVAATGGLATRGDERQARDHQEHRE